MCRIFKMNTPTCNFNTYSMLSVYNVNINIPICKLNMLTHSKICNVNITNKGTTSSSTDILDCNTPTLTSMGIAVAPFGTSGYNVPEMFLIYILYGWRRADCAYLSCLCYEYF